MSESHSLSISQYIGGLREGQPEAIQKIWERFYSDLIRLAYRKLRDGPNKVADWDDVVQEAMAQFFAQVQQGRFPDLNDRDDLWQVLVMLVHRRARDQQRRERADKRGGGKVFTESILECPNDPDRRGDLDDLAGVTPTPQVAEEIFANLSLALGELPTPDYRRVALLKLQGFDNKKIASQCGCSVATVGRRLANIRKLWGPEIDS